MRVTLDPAKNLDLYLRKGRDGSKVFQFFNADETPFDLDDEFEFLSGFDATLTKEDNELTLTVDGDDVEDVRNSYFWEIRNVTRNKTWLCGTAYFTDKLSAEATDTTEITIVEEGEPVVITIVNESGGSSGVDHWRGDYDASTNLFPALNVLGGDEFYVSTAGVLDGVPVPIGSILKARITTPGQTGTNWRVI